MSKVPKLRFSEFRDAGDWEEKQIHEFSKVTTGNKDTQDRNENGNYPFFVRSQTIERIDTFSFDGEAILTSGDGVGVGKNFHYINGKFDFHQREYCISNFSKNVSGKFFYLYFSKHFYNRVMQLSAKNSVDSVRMPMITDMTVPLPNLEEQQKIANCLTSIDTLITAQTQKLGTLKSHKKGLMQQLFPAEGETIPKLRFPEFRDSGEWKEKPLEKIFSIFQGFAFSSKDSAKKGTRWLKIADVSIQQMNHSVPSYLPTEYKEKYKKFLVKQGDYVIALTRPILSNRLKIATVDRVFHEALLNQRVGKLVTTQDISFIYFLLQTSQLISDIENGISGSEPPNLSTQQIKDIKNHIPSLKEQQKIANCLLSIDNLIAAQAKKIKALKAHKKGLMQQLFPSTDETNR